MFLNPMSFHLTNSFWIYRFYFLTLMLSRVHSILVLGMTTGKGLVASSILRCQEKAVDFIPPAMFEIKISSVENNCGAEEYKLTGEWFRCISRTSTCLATSKEHIIAHHFRHPGSMNLERHSSRLKLSDLPFDLTRRQNTMLIELLLDPPDDQDWCIRPD